MFQQVYTILIRLPGPPTARNSKEAQLLGRFSGAIEAPSIKMYADDVVSIHSIRPAMENLSSVAGTANQDVIVQHHRSEDDNAIATSTMMNKQALIRRPSHMQSDMRIPLKNVHTGGGGGKLTGAKSGAKVPVKKKKNSQEKKADKKAAKTLSAILAAFIITWTPYNILVLIKPLTTCARCIPQWLWDFFYYLCYINSTVNPVCYALCNATFRRTYVRILKCKWHSRNRTGVSRGY